MERFAAAQRSEPDGGDDEIVREVRAGAFARFEVLVRRHTRRVERAVAGVLRDGRDVEDAVQQTFLQAFVGLRGFAGSASFSTWLTRIAVNEALTRARRARLEPRGAWPLLQAAPTPGAAPDEAAASHEAIARVQAAVGRLPAHHREVFRLRHVDGLSIIQVAAQLGTTPEAVKVRLYRTRLVLRRALEAPRAAGRAPAAAAAPERLWTRGGSG
jgi:RNA polymerase sigma-70 factor, ECF subfamily